MKKNNFKQIALIGALCCMLIGCGQDTKVAETDSMKDVATESQDIAKEDEAVTEDIPEEAAAQSEDAEKTESETADSVLADGVYSADFETDSSMFHVNEAYENKGVLTVQDGNMTIHISLVGKGIVNLYPGLATDAQKEGAVLLEPSTDMVTYSDGMTEEVYGFDVPVPAVDKEFDLALLGTKGKWYDHKVIVKNPELAEESTESTEGTPIDLEDGEYQVELTLEGGSGKATIESPAKLVVADGVAVVTITWSSPNYDYMMLDGVKYEPVNTEGNSVFELPIDVLDQPIPVIGDTIAMSTPHEVEYTITCSLK